ncbi:L-asparagine permease [Renibacterium salmoninarum ATCC 33209]|uniref:L-asparagine permease n=1 Tax=Renibacterium salmoninarum (strain ATCC 33209 / DSM 20767 / JCM 11484 / NBRC 15589 / NCIMB 2235) TaxID=288705 RepID=A9WQ50_RENSM|nr:amino acid permease [Renibacterium salmoninarum]ABY22476.1 L-asparagine permease [Renibacterium salmoninarum ATCC 33209]
MASESQTDSVRKEHILEAEDAGYHKGLKNRQIQMIAIGGAIGTGLFMGSGGRLASAGPSLIISYAICGFFAFIILRALGELVLHRPSSGSFVSYAREFFGEKAAFVTGWMYWLNWAMTSIVDSTAVALYMNFFGKYWAPLGAVPQWIYALAALVIVLGLNLVSVKVFGEMEFWFALIKVVALVAFLLVGIYFVIFGTPIAGHEVGFSLIANNGGLFPNGILPALVVIQGVVFAYASVELVGTAAGETENPAKIIPKAINTVIFRIAIFYVGSLVLLSLLLPFNSYKEGESPFVTFFGSIGIQGIDAIMNLVVLTAALSSLNAGLYSTGRVLRSMAMAGSAPKFAARMNKSGVPYGGIALTAFVGLLGVVLNAIYPSQAFEIVLNVASLGIISAWAMIVLCQMRLADWAKKGRLLRPSFRLFGAPYTGYLTLLFLLTVLVLMSFDYPIGTFTVSSLVIIIPLLILGWFVFRGRIRELAEQRQGFTGAYPVVANLPVREPNKRQKGTSPDA